LRSIAAGQVRPVPAVVVRAARRGHRKARVKP
jgi:hypothetical protein